MTAENSRWSKTVPTLMAVLSVVVGCGLDAPDPLAVTGSGESSANRSLRSVMAKAGCVPHGGKPVYGTIGVPTDTGYELFTCTRVAGPKIHAAVKQYRENRQPTIQAAFLNLGGYTVRHFVGSQEYCDQWETSVYVGGKLTGRSYAWTNDCVTVSYYWDEWVPSFGDELPDQYPAGGGPYFGPNSPNEPRIDTMPKDNHICDQLRDTKCLIPLNDTDKVRIKDSLHQFIKNSFLITDSIARESCDSGRIWFFDAVNRGIIFRGRTDSFYVDPNGDGWRHDSQAPLSPDPSTRFMSAPMHIDPRHLNNMGSAAGKRKVLELIYHEVGHAVAGRDHVKPEGYANDSVYAAAGYPNHPYFKAVRDGSCFQ